MAALPAQPSATPFQMLLRMVAVASAAVAFSSSPPWSASCSRQVGGRRTFPGSWDPDRHGSQQLDRLSPTTSTSSSTSTRYSPEGFVGEERDDGRIGAGAAEAQDKDVRGGATELRGEASPATGGATEETRTSRDFPAGETSTPPPPRGGQADPSSPGGGGDDALPGDGPEQQQQRRHLSKVQWKKKTYLMMEDVKKEIRLRPKHAPRKAEEMVRRVMNLCECGGPADGSDLDGSGVGQNNDAEFYQKQALVQAYNLRIHALAKSGWTDAGYLAEDVLDEMRYYHIPPNVISYTSVMDAHARPPSRNGAGGAKAAQDFLLDVLQREGGAARNVNSLTFDTILNAYAQEGTVASAEQAELILLRLEGLQNDDGGTSNASIRPTGVSYATVINAWAKVGSLEAAERAEALLDRILKGAAEADDRLRSIPKARQKKKIENQQKDGVVRPDTVIFNAVINCWATSKHNRAGHRSVQLLEKMKSMVSTDDLDDEEGKCDVHPDIVTYNTVLSAWSHCGNENAAPQAEKIVKEMQREQEEYKLKQYNSTLASAASGRPPVVPNTVSYNTILDAWSKSQMAFAASRAQKVLDYMVQSGIPDIAPDVYSFTSVMDAWAKSKEAHKAVRTRELLDRLTDLYQDTRRKNLRPTQIPYNTVLNACAFSAQATSEEEQREALKIAVETFASMSTSSAARSSSETHTVRRDTVSYGNMLKCIANLVPKGDVRNRMALKVFQQCCEEGLVGSLVWNEIRRAVPFKFLLEAFGGDLQRSLNNDRQSLNIASVEVHQLPRHWTANNRFDKLLRAGSPKQHYQQQQGSKEAAGRRKIRRDDSSSSKSSTAKAAQATFIVEPSFASDKDI